MPKSIRLKREKFAAFCLTSMIGRIEDEKSVNETRDFEIRLALFFFKSDVSLFPPCFLKMIENKTIEKF